MEWHAHLPEEYLHRVNIPVHFEMHEETSVSAKKIHGFDRKGMRCFYFHEFLLSEERFDEDELFFELGVYHEMTVAWKMKSGNWLRLKAYADNLDDCNKRCSILPVEIVEECGLDR